MVPDPQEALEQSSQERVTDPAELGFYREELARLCRGQPQSPQEAGKRTLQPTALSIVEPCTAVAWLLMTVDAAGAAVGALVAAEWPLCWRIALRAPLELFSRGTVLEGHVFVSVDPRGDIYLFYQAWDILAAKGYYYAGQPVLARTAALYSCVRSGVLQVESPDIGITTASIVEPTDQRIARASGLVAHGANSAKALWSRPQDFAMRTRDLPAGFSWLSLPTTQVVQARRAGPTSVEALGPAAGPPESLPEVLRKLAASSEFPSGQCFLQNMRNSGKPEDGSGQHQGGDGVLHRAGVDRGNGAPQQHLPCGAPCDAAGGQAV